MALTKIGKEGITGISNSSNANAITIDSGENVTLSGTLGVTGDITGTLATAAQTNITSVGTLSSVTVNGTGTSNFTSTATSPVQINGTSIPTLTIRNSTTPVSLQMRATTSEGLVRTALNHPLVLGVNQSEKARIDTSGNVGIGITTPDGRLHVHSASAGSVTATSEGDELVVENNGNGGISILTPDANRSALFFGHASDNNKMQIRHDGNTSLSEIISDDSLNFAVGSGLKRITIGTGGDISFYEDTGTTPKLFWDASAEALGIGTSSVAAVLEVIGSKNGNWAGRFENTNTDGHGVLAVTASSLAEDRAFEVRKDTTDTAFAVTGNGYVGVGAFGFGTNPSYELHVKGSGSGYVRVDNTVAGNSGDVRVSLAKNGTTFGQIGQFSSTDFVISSQTSLGFMTNNQNFSNGTRAVTIDTSGNLLVGKTASAFGTGGIEIRGSDDASYFTRSGNAPVHINRLSSDGEIVRFNKDSSLVGSIGSLSGNKSYIVLDPNSGGSGVSCSAKSFLPTNSVGAPRNNENDVGSNTYRWKDLYLSGGVYLGGTGSANKLDDYEEGTWTPQIFSNTTQISCTSISGFYIVIGNQVFVYGGASRNDTASLTGSVQIKNLPFTSDSSNRNYSLTGGVWFDKASATDIVGLSWVSNNSAQINVKSMNGTGGATYVSADNFENGRPVYFSAAYKIA
jgi:hypothetical protein